jgi:hypothetical protein
VRALRPILAVIAALTVSEACARDCTPRDLPPGVRLPARPGCPSDAAPKPRIADEKPRPGRTPGFVDIGGGTELRIDGRVRAETRFRR